MEAYHMDIVSKDTRCFDVPQGACSVLRFVMSQEPLVDERVVSSNCKLIGVLEVYATHYLKFFAFHHCVPIILVFDVKHFFVRLHVPVIVVFVFDRGIVKDLSGTDMVIASETTQKQLWLTSLCLRYGYWLFWREENVSWHGQDTFRDDFVAWCPTGAVVASGTV
jgi:hypothetical protein